MITPDRLDERSVRPLWQGPRRTDATRKGLQVGRSPQPKRRRVTASALACEEQTKRRPSGKERDSEVSVPGCLIGLGGTGLFVLLATVDWLWGDDTWQWASEAWPGGAYGFAVWVGVCGPLVAALSVLCLSRMNWKSWREHTARTVANTVVGSASTTALVPYISLVFNAQDSGKLRQSAVTSPSWVFSNYPWLWAVGLLSTMATITALIWVLVVNNRRRRRAPDHDALGNIDKGHVGPTPQ